MVRVLKYSSEKAEVRSWLTFLRIEVLGISQEEMGKLLGYSDQAVSNWERSAREPRLTYEQWEALCECGRVSFEQLGQLRQTFLSQLLQKS